jgi:hypothetical protein
MKSGHFVAAFRSEKFEGEPLGDGLFTLATGHAVRDALARVGVAQRSAVAVRHGQQIIFDDVMANLASAHVPFASGVCGYHGHLLRQGRAPDS